MKKLNATHLITICLVLFSASALATGPYTSKIKTLQAVNIGSDYNTVHLELNVTDSPCSSTNSFNRFTIMNNIQHSTVLAAVMAGKTITIYGTGSCNAAGNESIGNVRVSP